MTNLSGVKATTHIIFENTGLGILRTTLDGSILCTNHEFAHMLGYSSSEELCQSGKNVKELMYVIPDERDVFLNILKQRNDISKFECRFRKKDNRIIFVSLYVNIYFDKYDNIDYFETLVEDITERKKNEYKIREQASLLDIATDAIIVRDLDDRILFWNKSAENLLGWQENEVLGVNITNSYYKDISVFNRAKNHILKYGEWNGEISLISKDGKDIIVQSRWSLISDENKSPKSILVVNSDITHKRKMEYELLTSQRMGSLGSLASGIAHDLNNIMTPILSGIQLLNVTVHDPRSKKILKTIDTCSRRCTNLIKQILQFAKGNTMEIQNLNLSALIEEVKKIIGETFPKNIEILTKIEDKRFIIFGDQTQIHQVLMNICINSKDAMPEGGKLFISLCSPTPDELRNEMELYDSYNDYILLTIADSGKGIPPEVQKRVFEPFFTTKEPGKGTGLGLSTVYSIIKNHHGFINFESSVNHGTKFKIYLPSAAKTEPDNKNQEPGTLPRGNGEVILVIDDELSILEITKYFLESLNFKAITSSNGDEAIRLFAENKDNIRIVLLDNDLPIITGEEIYKSIYSMNPDVKIIIMSGSNYDDLKHSYGSFHSFISKPFQLKDLIIQIHKALT
jgi:two-component system, cell cycle sensor histidine kinase and response regulator CckA